MKIVVVGAGAAGLRTAILLQRQGHEVLVAEARDRVGGRLQTIRAPNGYWDAGGEWVDSDHHRVLDLMAELGLQTESTKGMGGWLCFGDGKWSEDQPSPAMEHAENAFLALARREMGESGIPDRTMADALASVCESPEGKWYVTAKYRSDEGEDLERVGWRCWLQAFRLYAGREGGEMSQYRVSGGAQLIADEMARKVPNLHLGREVKGLEQAGESVWVHFKDGSREAADVAVITCPAPIVAELEWQPELPTMAAWRRARLGCAVKVSIQMKASFWDGHEFPGRLLSDRSFQQLWDSSHGDAMILQFYVCGCEGRRLTEGNHVVEGWLDEAEQCLPDLRSQMIGYQVHDWSSDPFSRGGFSTWGLNDDIGVRPFLSQTHGRVHFAGEHTASWCGFIEGALESAERVAEEVGWAS